MSVAQPSVAATALTYDADGVPALPSAWIDALLAPMGVSRQAPSLDYLAQLQWRWLTSQPFHNIDLLAGALAQDAPVSAAAALERTMRGLGGPCHVHAVSFLALLRGLGFSAHLCAATIGTPGDHLVSLVAMGDARWVCDVGNGHPYARPFPVGEVQEQARFGWRFVSEPCQEGLRLRRFLGDGRDKQVYVVDLTPRGYQDFSAIIAEHHRALGFGPFLTGVRAVRMTEHVMLTVRDQRYQRHSCAGTTTRSLANEAACARVLCGPLGLADLPVERALANLRALGQGPWVDATRDDTNTEIQAERPRVLMSTAVTERPRALERLGQSLLSELWRTGFAGGPEGAACTLLIVENSPHPLDRAANARTVVELGRQGLDVVYIDRPPYGRPIAESRLAQTHEIARWCAQSGHPSAVWMVDDDMVLAQAIRAHGARLTGTEIDYFTTWSSLAQRFPEVSVAIGGVTGDPPIRPDAMLRTQLFDLTANIERFARLDPTAPYHVPEQASAYALPDYYYDHTRDGSAHLDTPFYWLRDPDAAGTVRAQWLAMLARALDIGRGCAVTRPLLYAVAGGGSDGYEARQGTRRGGNTVFFDVDACLFHTYPAVEVAGVYTRRSDMIGATRLNAAGPWQVRELGPSLLHRRDGAPQRSVVLDAAGETIDRSAAERTLVSEFFGVMLARLVMDGQSTSGASGARLSSLQTLAAQRAERILTNLAVAGEHADGLIERLGGPLESRGSADWWRTDRDSLDALARLHRVIEGTARGVLGGTDERQRASWREHLRRTFCDPDHLARIVEAFHELDQSDRMARSRIGLYFGESGARS